MKHITQKGKANNRNTRRNTLKITERQSPKGSKDSIKAY